MHYQDMANEELDRLAAEMMGVFPSSNDPTYYRGVDYGFMFIKDWNPTHPDSNQSRKYLLPMIFNKVPDYLDYEVVMEMGDWHVQWSDTSEDWEVRVDVDFEDDENINNENRAVVICCLKTWEKLDN